MPAHIKSALVGASVTIPIRDGKLATGTWQGICTTRPLTLSSLNHFRGEMLTPTLQGISSSEQRGTRDVLSQQFKERRHRSQAFCTCNH